MRLLGVIMILAVFPGIAASERVNNKRRNVHAPWVSCLSEDGVPFAGPKMVRTPVPTSGDGTKHAYAEIVATRNRKAPDACENVATLHISGPGTVFRSVFVQRPSIRNGTANSLAPHAWSADNRSLLVERGRCDYASDFGGLDILLFDSRTGPPGCDPAKLAIHCVLAIQEILGFNRINEVLGA